MEQLISIRIKSFLYGLLGLVVTGVAGFLTSEGLANLITEHFGATAITSIVLLVVQELGKHLRNVQVTKKLGSTEGVELI